MTMQTKWQSVKLGKLAKFRNGINYNKNNFGKGLKVINVKDFQDYSFVTFEDLEEINPDGLIREDNFLKENDIIFVRSNGNRQLIGRSLFVRSCPERISHSAFSIKLRFDSEEVYPLFYAYLFRTSLIRETLSSQGNGTNISNLNQEILSNLKVPLPPLPTQRKIAGILSAYDDLIENNTRRIEILEEMARMLYREWFVKFRFPVDGENGGGDRPSGGVGKNGGDRPSNNRPELVESELGLIPKGWEVKKLIDVCNLTMGQSPKSEFYNETGEGLPFHQGVTNFGDRFPTDKTYTTVLKRIAEEGDILFSVRAPVGRLNLANKRMVLGRGLCSIRSKDSYQELLFQQLKEQFHEDDLIGGGTIYKSVTKDDVQNIKFLIPPKSLILQFTEKIKPIFRQIEIFTLKNINLRKTRDLLLPRLISGEIDVEALDINLGAIND